MYPIFVHFHRPKSPRETYHRNIFFNIHNITTIIEGHWDTISHVFNPDQTLIYTNDNTSDAEGSCHGYIVDHNIEYVMETIHDIVIKEERARTKERARLK